MDLSNPRIFVTDRQYSKRIRSLAWQLHCARNRGFVRAAKLEAMLRAELQKAGVR